MKDIVRQVIERALSVLSIGDVSFVVERPNDLAHGDYATNVALVVSKQLKQSPRTVAERVAALIQEQAVPAIAAVTVAGPGFINITLRPDYFEQTVATVCDQKKTYGTGSLYAGKNVIVEYTDPNPFKELHIGHVMSNAIGESIARVIACAGANVIRASYHGDVGLHVAKALWAYQKQGNNDLSYLVSGKAYADGNRAFEEDVSARKEIEHTNKLVYERTDERVNAAYDAGRAASFDSFYRYLAKIGTTFDMKFYESESGPIGKALVESNIGNVFEQSEGAVVFPEEKSGLHTRVFLNSHGLPTYEAKELGLAKLKAERCPFDTSIVVTGNEINDYFKVLLRAMALLMPDVAAKTLHVSHGMLRLPTGKMSSRTGTVVTATQLFDEVQKAIMGRMEDRGLSSVELEAVSWQIAVAAVKYSILRQSPGSDIIYDFEKSISVEGDSGPYIQYTAVRARSVVRKAAEQGIPVVATRPVDEHLSVVERLIPRFPEIASRAASELAPHHVANYLIELSSAFNNFYTTTVIIGEKTETTSYRVALTDAVATVLENGLALLGIEVPAKM